MGLLKRLNGRMVVDSIKQFPGQVTLDSYLTFQYYRPAHFRVRSNLGELDTHADGQTFTKTDGTSVLCR